MSKLSFISLNHDLIAILNVEATDGVLDAAALQVVDGVSGRRVADGTDARGLSQDVIDTGGGINLAVTPLRITGSVLLIIFVR